MTKTQKLVTLAIAVMALAALVGLFNLLTHPNVKPMTIVTPPAVTETLIETSTVSSVATVTATATATVTVVVTPQAAPKVTTVPAKPQLTVKNGDKVPNVAPPTQLNISNVTASECAGMGGKYDAGTKVCHNVDY